MENPPVIQTEGVSRSCRMFVIYFWPAAATRSAAVVGPRA